MDTVNYSKTADISKHVINECFQKYKPSEIFVAFNGGKDCTVMLDLILKCWKSNPQHNDDDKLLFVYIKPESPFPELEEFIHSIKIKYNLNLTIVNGNIKTALENILNEDSNIKACFMGTRRTDPYSEHLEFFQMTDIGWPQIMRVNPLLNWTYHQIWSYLIDNHVPYCDLYREGYTSIGNTLNTIPNPSLKVTDPSTGAVTYKPAYFLEDGSLERSGRITAKGVN